MLPHYVRILQVCAAESDADYHLALGPIMNVADVAGLLSMTNSIAHKSEFINRLCHFLVSARNMVATEQLV
jgi:hypothetical protein